MGVMAIMKEPYSPNCARLSTKRLLSTCRTGRASETHLRERLFQHDSEDASAILTAQQFATTTHITECRCGASARVARG